MRENKTYYSLIIRAFLSRACEKRLEFLWRQKYNRSFVQLCDNDFILSFGKTDCKYTPYNEEYKGQKVWIEFQGLKRMYVCVTKRPPIHAVAFSLQKRESKGIQCARGTTDFL